MRVQTWRGLAAGSSLLMALAVVYLYWRFIEIPFVEFVPAAGYRSFLLVFPGLATVGLLLWGVASFQLKAGIWRYGLALLAGLGALAIVGLTVSVIIQEEIGRPWAVPLALMPAVLLGMVAWILFSKRTSFRWGRVIVYLVAALLVFAPVAGFLANAYSLEAGLEHLALAVLPFALVVLGYLIGLGFAKLSLVNLAAFAIVSGAHLYWTIRGLGVLGKAFSSVTGRGLLVLGGIALVAGVLAFVNWKAFRTSLKSS